jgi:hypothetical protein
VRACRSITVKTVELVPVPLAFVIAILPVDAPEGTTAVICVEEFTTNVAETPPNFTDVVPVKFVPLITTEVPAGPLVGENDEIVGFPVVTVNRVELQTVPAGVVTEIFPVVAPVGTVAVSLVDDTMVKAADVPANFTDVAPEKFVPVIVTSVPTGPLFGENPEIVALAPLVVTVNAVSLQSVPSGVVTEILPVVAPEGTMATILVFHLTVNSAETPANLTAVAPLKLSPTIATSVPTGPLVGENDEIVGTAAHDAGAIAIETNTTPETNPALASALLPVRDIALPSLPRAGSFGAPILSHRFRNG